jgi:hypothetical protein
MWRPDERPAAGGERNPPPAATFQTIALLVCLDAGAFEQGIADTAKLPADANPIGHASDECGINCRHHARLQIGDRWQSRRHCRRIGIKPLDDAPLGMQ